MPEFYEITVEDSSIAFGLSQGQIPAFALQRQFEPGSAPAGVSVICRMGAADQFHCVIFRRDDQPGGIFALHEQGKILFVAVAKSDLAYALAKGYFGSLVANARYGVDIYESEDSDD